MTADSIELDNLSAIVSEVLAIGAGGDVTVQATDSLALTNGARISTTNEGLGASGNLAVNADRIELDNLSTITSEVVATGAGGDVTVQAIDSLALSNRARISTSNGGNGTSGNLSVTSESIVLDGNTTIIGSVVSASGAGGNVTVQATEDITIINEASISTLNNGNDGEAISGNLSVFAERLVLDDAFIDSVVLASGAGGDLVVDATDITATNRAAISTTNQGKGTSGRLSVIADHVVLDDAGILTGTLGSSDAGDITVQVTDQIELNSGSIFSSSTTNADSGDISLVAGDITLRNNSRVLASNFASPEVADVSEAAAGSVDVRADSISLDRSGIRTTGNLGNGGNLSVTANDFLLLRNGSQISTSAGLLSAGGDGGNITIDAPFVVAVLSEDSDITANAFAGSGGSVTISALDIIGLEFQDEITPFSDITASSQIGVDGVTEFNPLSDESIEGGLTELPVNLTDPTGLISQQCALQASDSASEFTVVGRGGLPPDPSQPGTADTFLEDLGAVPREPGTTPEQSRTEDVDEPASPRVIQEAQGWMQDTDGKVYLVSTASQNTALPSPDPMNCPHSQH